MAKKLENIIEIIRHLTNLENNKKLL